MSSFPAEAAGTHWDMALSVTLSTLPRLYSFSFFLGLSSSLPQFKEENRDGWIFLLLHIWVRTTLFKLLLPLFLLLSLLWSLFLSLLFLLLMQLLVLLLLLFLTLGCWSCLCCCQSSFFSCCCSCGSWGKSRYYFSCRSMDCGHYGTSCSARIGLSSFFPTSFHSLSGTSPDTTAASAAAAWLDSSATLLLGTAFAMCPNAPAAGATSFYNHGNYPFPESNMYPTQGFVVQTQ